MQGGNGFRMIVFSRGRFLVRSPASFGFLEILPKINLDDFNQSFEQHHVEVFCDAKVRCAHYGHIVHYLLVLESALCVCFRQGVSSYN